MFNFFKPKEKIDEVALINAIHNEFDEAQDILLDQAESILASLEIPTESQIEKRANRLKLLGFSNASSVKQSISLQEKRKEVEKKLVSTKEQADIIKYYKQNYPFQKFITEEVLETICKKYNLVFAPVSAYIKDVPEKNIDEIEKTPLLKPCDILNDRYFVKISEFWRDCGEQVLNFFKDEIEYFPSKYEEIKNESEPSEKNLTQMLRDAGIFHSGYIFKKATVKKVQKKGLFIAAPASYFDLSELEKDGKFGYAKVTEWEISDPIVFRYVRGGIQIITKWGLEASDEALVNEIEN